MRAPAGVTARVVMRLAEPPPRQPGRDHEGDRERDQHAHAGVDRDRAHVRPHQAGDEGHGQQRGDDGEGREDGGAAHLVDRARDDRGEWQLGLQQTMAVNVLHYHDGASTRMPMEKISANSETRLSVKPQAQDANSLAARVSTTAVPTMAASRRPSAKNTSATTRAVASNSFSINLSAFS